MAKIAQLRSAVKRYGEVEALRGVDLELRPGEVLALLGPNGAGKTTAVSLLLGLVRPDAGTAALFGGPPDRPEARRRIGVTPQETSFPETLRVREIVDLVRVHYPAPAPADALLARFGLEDVASRQAGGLSGGQRRRLAIALAFAGNPEAVFLDEPTTGLDVAARRAVWQAVRDFVAGGGSVLLTTHYLEEAEALATRVVMLHRGRVLAEGTPAEIQARVGICAVRFRLHPEVPLPELAAAERVERAGERVTVWTRDSDAAVRDLVRRDVPFAGLEIQSVSLEDAFLLLTGDAEHEAVAGARAG